MSRRVVSELQSATVRSGLQPARRRVAIAAVLTAMMLVVLDAGMVNVALPSIARSFQVTPALSVQVVTAYQLALVMALLPCAALGESWGYRRVFMAGVVLFTAASVFSALSSSLSWLFTARFLQGLGGAGVMALGVAMLRMIVPQGQFAAAIGWNALVVALSTAAGPTIGSLILSRVEWPWLFALNVPFGLLVLFAALAFPRVYGTARRLDLVSVVLNAGVFSTFVIGVEIVLTAPAPGGLLVVASVLGAIVLFRREMPKMAPLIPIDLLQVRSFRLSVIASICCFAGQTVAILALPFYLQHGLGLNIMTTGLYLTTWPLTVALAAPIAGRLAAHISTAWLCAMGGTILAIGLAAAAMWPLNGYPQPLIGFTMLCGVGFGLFNVANNHSMFLSVSNERSGSAGGMQGTARLMGQTAGAMIMTLFFTLFPTEVAPRIALGSGAVLTLLAGLVSMLRVQPSRPRADASQ
jgi:MFS transporter, DHA2 family, multidrug resistance protein